MIKRFSVLLILTSFVTACLGKPVLQKENHIPVGKSNIETVCNLLTDKFPDYSCEDYLDKTYTTGEKEETVKIELQQETLNLSYHTESDNNELFDRYEAVVDSLGKQF